jgi:hypothetical protein
VICALCHDSGPALVTSRVEGKGGYRVDRCALFVDAGYVLADGAMAVHGTRQRDSVSWDYAGLVKLLTGISRDRTGLPLLRCYWYEATVEGRRSPEHNTLADLPGVKLRMGRMRPGRREGVEAEMHRDLTTLARNHAVSDAVVVSAEEDLAEVVAEVQEFGLRVLIVHIAADGNWTVSRPLRQECDEIVEISAAHLRPFVDLIAGAEPSDGDDQYRSGSYQRRVMGNGHGPGHGAMTHQGLPAAALPAPPTIYTGPLVEEYQRTAHASGPLALSALAAAAAVGPPPHHHHAADAGRAPGRGSAAAPPDGQEAPDQAPPQPQAQPHSVAAHSAPEAAVPQAPAAQPGARDQAGAPDPGGAQAPMVAPLAVPPRSGYVAQPGDHVPAPNGYAFAPGADDWRGAGGPAPDAAPGRQGAPPQAPAPQLAVQPAPVQHLPVPQAPVPAPPGPAHQAAGPQEPARHDSMPQVVQNGMPHDAAPHNMSPQNALPQRAVHQNAGPQEPVLPAPVPQDLVPQDLVPQDLVPQDPAQQSRAPLGRAQPLPPRGPAQQAPQNSGQHAQMPQNQVPADMAPQAARPSGPGVPYQDAGAPGRYEDPSSAGSPGRFAENSGPGRFADGASPARFADGPAPSRFGEGGGRFAEGSVPARFGDAGGPARFADPPGQPPYPPAPPGAFGAGSAAHVSYPQFPGSQPGQHAGPGREPEYAEPPRDQGPFSGPQPAAHAALARSVPQPMAVSLADAVQAAHAEGFGFGDAVARDAPALWLEAVLARKPRMPSDLEARLLQGSALPIDSLLHDEVRHSLRRGFWDALERSRR